MATKPTQSNEWISRPPIGQIRIDANGVCTNNHQLLVIGGASKYTSHAYHIRSSEYYDSNTFEWTALPKIDMPTPRHKFGATRVGDRIFVMGGNDGSSFGNALSDLISITLPASGDILTGDCSSFKWKPQEWKTLAPMKEGRNRFACVSHSNSIYVFGGFGVIGGSNGNRRLDTAERYDIDTDTWVQLPNMPGKRSMSAAEVVGDKIYVVGGSDRNSSALASTIVFDISKQQWEPQDDLPVPNMKSKREGHSVVAVEQFIVAIGGFDGRFTLSSIEVLDTQRNTWKSAKVPMKHARSLMVAKYLKKSKEIMIVGGMDQKNWPLAETESIKFEEGLLPVRYKVKERGQEMVGDTDRGKDRLGVAVIAVALAETLVFKDLKPPFVLAVFGKWGRGKSYFFNLMLEELIKIQKRPVDNLVQNTFAGHIYVVRFDAWTFSKGDIWSSLMYQILKTLNEQLQFEERFDNEKLKAGIVSTIQVFRDLSTLEIEDLKEHQELLEEIKSDGDRASERLLRAINANYEKDKEDLLDLENQIQKARNQKHAITAVKEMKRHLNFLGKIALNRVLDEALKNSDENDGSLTELVSSIRIMNRLFLWCFSLRLSNIPPSAIICSALLIVLSTFSSLNYEDRVVTIVSGSLSAAIPVITSISAALTKIDPVIASLEHQSDGGTPNESASPLLGSLPRYTYGSIDNDKTLQELENQKMKIKNRTLALKGQSLRETIATKINASDYENNLGIVHKVQQDLKLISDGMLNPRQREIFPRGDPRIVLFIDDLDRCKHSEVVKVIEALQLLVKTKLFVAVLAIDPRYVTLSLEKHYSGILDPVIPPTGMDFLEKMVQIPFRLPGACHDSIDEFVENEIIVREPDYDEPGASSTLKIRENGNDEENSESTTNHLLETSSNDSEIITPVAENNSEKIKTFNASVAQEVQSTNQIPREVEEDLPSSKIHFTNDEKLMMKEVLKLFGVEPRCLRRIVNVFKVLKVIWRRDTTGRFQENKKLKRATLFMMLLASDNLTRRVTFKIFHWMEMGTVQYHRVINQEKGETQNSLANLIKTELYKDKRFNCTKTDAKVDEGTLIAHVDKYLSDYTWKSSGEWNAVSQQFLLARSFTFYRLVTTDMDSIEQQLMNENQ